MSNIRLTLAYDGTAYCGWQVQPNARTVQAEVQAAIKSLTGEDVSVLSAGRTDSGVHALGQVANFVTASTIPAEKWRPALQGKLPSDIVVLDSREVPPEFHATYSAFSKRYRYLIRQSLVDDPFIGRYAWRIGGELDIAAMNQAAGYLLGTHDFRCFESAWPNKATSVRTIQAAACTTMPRWPGWSPFPLFPRWSSQSATDAITRGAITRGATGSASANQGAPPRSDEPAQQPSHPAASNDAEFLCFEIEADGFLYNMVRAIVGTLVNVGRGKWPADCVSQIIAGQDRSAAGETAPAHGLYLARVRYPGDEA